MSVEEGFYEVASIEDHKFINGQCHYLVNWKSPTKITNGKGGMCDSSWEPSVNVDNCRYLLTKYWCTYANNSHNPKVNVKISHTMKPEDFANLDVVTRTWDAKSLDSSSPGINGNSTTKANGTNGNSKKVDPSPIISVPAPAPLRSSRKKPNPKVFINSDDDDDGDGDYSGSKTTQRATKRSRATKSTGIRKTATSLPPQPVSSSNLNSSAAAASIFGTDDFQVPRSQKTIDINIPKREIPDILNNTPADTFRATATTTTNDSSISDDASSVISGINTPTTTATTTTTTRSLRSTSKRNIGHPQLKDRRKNIAQFAKILDKAKGPHILIENNIDSEGPPDDFTYIDESIYPPGIMEATMFCSETAAPGCTCKNCESQIYSCEEDTTNISSPGCKCGAMYPEYPSCYDFGGLVQIPPGYAIYECGAQCNCPSSCQNRVVQHGLQLPLVIFKTAKKGWGVKARKFIREGTFICEYVGEVISQVDANKRTEEFQKTARNYLFDLDYMITNPSNPNSNSNLNNTNDNNNIDNSDQDAANKFLGYRSQFVIDGRCHSNVSHFFNHSCDPNLRVYPVFIDHTDATLHRIAFFASKDIDIGQELCFDYMGGGNGAGNDNTAASGIMEIEAAEEAEDDRKLMECHCGASNCRKYIWN
ncbi:hypothetical protein H4219_005775 [Mycoemilia scoparia]|uniref:Histone-lysine N-methyltransferase n=1 Tax=Mycoemilia scoparia TaxID=417184 RepID=A0A9W8DJ64_9FUNG|nr:hypothetical protein H4219_005775 [Mycoemilia scoparia]